MFSKYSSPRIVYVYQNHESLATFHQHDKAKEDFFLLAAFPNELSTTDYTNVAITGSSNNKKVLFKQKTPQDMNIQVMCDASNNIIINVVVK